ncbi:SET domain-containing protein [Amniculicola lignicola CBS 123094]|uniref:SET domain-containing protein n=1 Tax=Amniculicola lignicola CBS 123094 TaxID=1392246 RepID=A0A6A5WZG7_9PLEO|nr:SET domain-containing protein [Amniculicola lignicola CBS 123094]
MPSVVVIPGTGHSSRRVLIEKVHSILSNRVRDGEEQYLVRWKTNAKTSTPALSWHVIDELSRCLEHVQDYLDVRSKAISVAAQLRASSNKRKSPDTGSEEERRPSPLDRQLGRISHTPSSSRSSSVSSNVNTNGPSASPSVDVYNGVLDHNGGFVFGRRAAGPDVPRIDIKCVPTPEMSVTARRSSVKEALTCIRAEYIRRLARVPGQLIYLVNIADSSTPSLRFHYISDYICGEGVTKMDIETQVGCQKCSPHMGKHIGCEYTKRCDCLEYAKVDEARLKDDQQRAEYEYAIATGGSTMGFPKKFPYFAEGTRADREGCLVSFYLTSRNPIYECNAKCRCGPYCRNKNVQFGRQVELEIFKTANSRGWGLRCRQKLFQGQFIDTYRGEIITDAEATRREEAAHSKMKASYLYSLDKFAETEQIDVEDLYVVDGQFMGGPTVFMNHSCDPNCRQYTVSYNKNDPRIYDLAFFACRDIEAGEELTFDYLDKEEEDEEKNNEATEDPSADAVPCLCGSDNCRKWLWT